MHDFFVCFTVDLKILVINWILNFFLKINLGGIWEHLYT